eukprot:scaffold14576_cov132-Isochrysis_galbana.AAC.7
MSDAVKCWCCRLLPAACQRQCASTLCAAVSARVFSLHVRIGICGNSEERCGVSLHVQYPKFCHEAPVPTRFIKTPCGSSKANVLLSRPARSSALAPRGHRYLTCTNPVAQPRLSRARSFRTAPLDRRKALRSGAA